MPVQPIDAPDAHGLNAGYAHAMLVTRPDRTLYVSGQVGLRLDGSLAEGFEAQARQAWANVEAQLRAAGMTLGNVVHHTTFLSDRRYAAQNAEVRKAVLGELRPALTTVVTGIFDEAWLLEIQAIAVD